MGFGATIRSKLEKDMGELLVQVLPEDLLKFGLIPEFVGRLPVIGAVSNLDQSALVEILVEPKNALVKQYRKFFEFEDVELEFTGDALEAVADQALLRGTGARGLRAILEEVLLNVMYDLPGRSDIGRCVIDGDTVKRKVNPTLIPARRPARNVLAAPRPDAHMTYPGAHAQADPAKAAVIMGGTGAVLTYGELEDRSRRLAQLWWAAGLRPGDHVAIFAENRPEYFEVVWAALRSGPLPHAGQPLPDGGGSRLHRERLRRPGAGGVGVAR